MYLGVLHVYSLLNACTTYHVFTATTLPPSLPPSLHPHPPSPTTSASVAWTYNGGHVPVNSQLVMPRAGVWELQLSAVQEDNAGLYVCLAHSHMGLYSDAISLELDVYGRKENFISSDEWEST